MLNKNFKLLAITISTLVVYSCNQTTNPVNNVPDNSIISSTLPDSNITSNPISIPTLEATPTPIPTSTVSSNVTTSPSPVATATPSTTNKNDIDKLRLLPVLKSNYRLTVDGNIMDGSGNLIYSKLTQPASGNSGKIELASKGYETVSDSKNDYSFTITFLPSDLLINIPYNFNQNDFKAIYLEVRKNGVKYYSELPITNGAIPLSAYNGNLDKPLGVLYADGTRFSGYVNGIIPNVDGGTPINVTLEWEYAVPR